MGLLLLVLAIFTMLLGVLTLTGRGPVVAFIRRREDGKSGDEVGLDILDPGPDSPGEYYGLGHREYLGRHR